MSVRGTGRALLAVAACVVATFAAVGWLYLLREVPSLHAGPAVSGALPLQRLAHQETQPLLRVLLAWAPAGLGAGIVLVWATRLRAASRALVAGATAFVILFATGALSDAVTASESLGMHLAPQFSHEGLWIGTAVMALCAALASPARAPRGEATP
jgi:hypothetical protein